MQLKISKEAEEELDKLQKELDVEGVPKHIYNVYDVQKEKTKKWKLKKY